MINNTHKTTSVAPWRIPSYMYIVQCTVPADNADVVGVGKFLRCRVRVERVHVVDSPSGQYHVVKRLNSSINQLKKMLVGQYYVVERLNQSNNGSQSINHVEVDRVQVKNSPSGKYHVVDRLNQSIDHVRVERCA